MSLPKFRNCFGGGISKKDDPCIQKSSFKRKSSITILLLILLGLRNLAPTISPVYAASFSAGMAKRNAPGPFTSAPIVQGTMANPETDSGDSLSISSGSQIGGNFYDNFDGTQGSIVFWITPEWNGNDGKVHNIFSGSGSKYLLRQHGGGWLQIHSGSTAAISGPSTTSWTAGTTYLVVVSWDANNTFDGTNHVRFSINDSHAYAGTSFNSGIDPTFYLGLRNGFNRADAIIEGLTIYRRPLYDPGDAGASPPVPESGIDVGNGDEIALIHASGTGKDPTLITGSWDVVFALPTNSSTGALTTGEGEAWTHPHALNLLGGTNGVNGFLLSTAWDQFTAEGSPTSPDVLATGEKIFAGGYKYTSDAANEGYYRDITVSPGDSWAVRALAHSDGTSVPKIILYDQNNTTEIGSLTGTTTSTRSDPDVFIFTGSTISTADDAGKHDGSDNQSVLTDSSKSWTNDEWIGYTIYNTTDGSSGTITANTATAITATLSGGTENDWDNAFPINGDSYEIHQNDPTTLRVKLINSDATANDVTYWHQIEVVSNLIANPSMESGSGNPWIPTGWENLGFDAGDTLQGATIHSGSSSFQATENAALEMIVFSSQVFAVGNYYSAGFWSYGNGAGNRIDFLMSGYGKAVFQHSLTEKDIYGTTDSSWVKGVGVYRALNVNPKLVMKSQGTAVGNRFIDDLYFVALTDVELTVTPANQDNSTENTDEIRVDGRDTYIETAASSLGTTSGYASFDWRPRHSASTCSSFDESSDDAYIISFTDSDNSDYVNVYWDSSNTMKLAVDTGSGENTDTWDAAGLISADSQYAMVVQYTNGGNITVSVGGTERLSISMADAFDESPDDAYFGSNYSSSNQGDATFSELVFDNTAPSISLTALSPDPNNDNTPSVTGTATEAIGTVSNVQYQMDGTGGSWTSCTADDGTFDEASEAFTCTVSPALSDGSHTIYVRATDSNGNTTGSGSESEDTFTIDVTSPLSFTPTCSPSSWNQDNTPTITFSTKDAVSGVS